MKLYTIQWNQPYIGWSAPNIEDLAQAREVIARIMAL